MLGIGLGEFLALAVVAMIVLGPEKLPRYAADAARFLRSVRRMAAAARADVRRELGPEFDDISLSDLNPRTLVRRHLLEPIDLDELDDLDDDPRRRPSRENRSRDTRPREEGARGRSGRTSGPGAADRRTPGRADGSSGEAVDGDGADRPAPPYDPETT